jgi:hypothetical protein
LIVSDLGPGYFASGYNCGGTYAPNKLPINIAWVGVSFNNNQMSVDNFTGCFAHEFVESMSQDTQVTRPLSLSIQGDSQICDGEPNYGYLYRVNGYLVVAYWSRNYNSYIVPDGNKQNFVLTPIWTPFNSSHLTYVFSHTYNLAVSGDQLGTNYNDVTQVEGGSNYGAVYLNGETATFEPNSIVSATIDSRGGNNFVVISSLPGNVTLNVNNTGGGNDAVSVDNSGSISGNTGSLVGIQGTINISNSSGKTYLLIRSFCLLRGLDHHQLHRRGLWVERHHRRGRSRYNGSEHRQRRPNRQRAAPDNR